MSVSGLFHCFNADGGACLDRNGFPRLVNPFGNRLGCHWPVGSWPHDACPKRFQRIADGVVGCCSLETAMGHAVGALGIFGVAMLVPVGLLHQGLEGGRIAFVHQQITGLLPAKDIAGGVAPWCAIIALIARQEIQI